MSNPSSSDGASYTKPNQSQLAAEVLATPPLSSHWSYEATVAEIETIINRIEMGELELAEIFDQFGTAIEHLRQCETFLGQQQQQMDLLIETLLDEPEMF